MDSDPGMFKSIIMVIKEIADLCNLTFILLRDSEFMKDFIAKYIAEVALAPSGLWLAPLFFLFIYEITSWPMRMALMPIPMAPDIRRMISRVSGPPIIVGTAWIMGHGIIDITLLNISQRQT